jgi:hypothetical protein
MEIYYFLALPMDRSIFTGTKVLPMQKLENFQRIFFPKGQIRVFLIYFISNISHANCGHENEFTWCFGGLDLRLLC